MWQFAEAVRGLADGCQELGIPVTGGNVSFYNQTGAAAIHPTPVVGVLGILQDVARRVPMGFPPPPTADGDLLFLLGETRSELSGSEWAWVTHGHLGGRPPKVDLAHEQRLGRLLAQASEREHIVAAHDLSDGGLSQVLVESCLRRNVGARVMLPEQDEATTPFVWLFSESAGRVLVAVPRGHDKAFAALAAEHGVPCTQIGVTAEEPVLDVHGQFTITLDELREAFTSTMRNLFGGAAEGPRPAAVSPVAEPAVSTSPGGNTPVPPPVPASRAPEVSGGAETDDAGAGQSVTLELSKSAEAKDSASADESPAGPAAEAAELPAPDAAATKESDAAVAKESDAETSDEK
jgi:phosphoribosylformylglycinamidine synthase